jgi:predicted nucleic acid-binding protein
MSRYLLDTGPLTAFLLGRTAARALIRPWSARREVDTSIVTYAEVVEYLKSFPNFSTRRRELRALLHRITPLPLTYAVLERYADVRRRLRPPHGPGVIGDIDTLIAATALEHDLTVVTTDGDFQRVPGLKVRVVTLR